MRIAMMGSGAVGGYFGGRMAAAGCDVTFIARGRQLEAILDRGLQIDSPALGGTCIHPATATDDPREVGPVDYIIVGVKLWDTVTAANALLPMLGPETTVLTLQNGVESAELERVVGPQRMVGAVAFIGCAVTAPGVIRHVGTMQQVVVGEFGGGSSPRVERLRAELDRGGVEAVVSNDIRRKIWEKFVFLVGLSAATSAKRVPLGAVLRDPEARELFLGAMLETVAVGRARGIDLNDGLAEDRLDFADGLPPDMTSSMHTDLERGNRLELEWLSGAVVRFGREEGIATPINTAVCAALSPYANGRGR